MNYKLGFQILISLALAALSTYAFSLQTESALYAPLGAASLFLACVISVTAIGEYLIEYYFPESGFNEEADAFYNGRLQELANLANKEIADYRQEVLDIISVSRTLEDAGMDIAALDISQIQITHGGSR